jgi:hypothetical protein
MFCLCVNCPLDVLQYAPVGLGSVTDWQLTYVLVMASSSSGCKWCSQVRQKLCMSVGGFSATAALDTQRLGECM